MIYLFLADGFEDMEAVVPYDLLKREGKNVVTAGVTGKTVVSAHGLKIVCDITAEDIDMNSAEAVILPGGMPGAINLHDSEVVKKAVKYAAENDLYICSICASPGVVLGDLGVLDGHRYTCFPGFEVDSGIYTGSDVETDGNLITASGPEAAFLFGKKICELL